jgi:uncharacterized delta-60 repeat protein
MKQSGTTPRERRVGAAAAACIVLVAAACERPTMPTLTPEGPTNAETAEAPAPPLSETTWGGAGSDVTEGAAVASDGSTYLVGFTNSFGGGASKVFAVKLTASGSLAWQRTWDAPPDAFPFVNDEAHDVAVASDGSVYVTGSTFVGGNGALLLKFSSDGSLLWQRAWGGNAHGEGVAVAADGSVYVTGATRSFGAGEEDLFVTKFAPDGALVWFKTWGAADASEEGQGVAVGPDGNVYVAGVGLRAGDPFLHQFDAVVLKLDPAGSVIWQRSYAGGDVTDARGGIAVGSDGSVYVAGGFQEAAKKVTNDALLLRVAPDDGSLVWARQWGGDSGDFAEGVAVAPDGRVVFVGSTNSYGQGSDDAFLLRLEPGGKTSDASTWGSAGLDKGSGVGVAPDGTVSLGATVESPPYVLDRAPAHTSRARLSVATPTLVLVDASGVASDPGGIVETPAGSTTYAGSFDAALVRFAP